jgi:hypothetical protein
MRAFVIFVIASVTSGAWGDEPELELGTGAIPALAVLPAPSGAEPIPPPIVAAPLRPLGHWRVEPRRRGALRSGLVIGAVAYVLTAAIGLGTGDYWLCIPVVGPLVGSLRAPRGLPNPIDYGADAMVPGVMDMLLQGGLAPALTLAGFWPKTVWQLD